MFAATDEWLPVGGFICLGTLLAIGSLAFWIWMLIDCIQNEPPEGNDKIIWVLVILLLHGLGALIYYFVRRPQRLGEFGK
jgi:hypothetical protein